MVSGGTTSCTKMKQSSLYDRLGGESFMVTLMCSLFDEWNETPALEPFFRHVPTETLKTHHAKFFRLIFGPKEFHPKADDMFDYIMLTHARLFREYGLNATHFDLLVEGFAQVLDSFSIEEGLVDEVTTHLAPYRAMFEYGAKVAVNEKDMDDKTRKTLPLCKGKHMGTDTPVVLPCLSSSTIPSWLTSELKHLLPTKSLRDWTTCLSDRCSVGADKYLADCFMDIPYPKLELYMIELVKLMVVPTTINDYDTIVKDTLQALRYPRGQNKDPLSRCLFERLIVQVSKVCNQMDVPCSDTKPLLNQLRTRHSHAFPNVDPPKIYGMTNPHCLAIIVIKKNDTTMLSPKKRRSTKSILDSIKGINFEDDEDDDDDDDTAATTQPSLSSSTMNTSNNNNNRPALSKMKNGIRKLLGKAA